jgi:hypothetical protein
VAKQNRRTNYGARCHDGKCQPLENPKMVMHIITPTSFPVVPFPFKEARSQQIGVAMDSLEPFVKLHNVLRRVPRPGVPVVQGAFRSAASTASSHTAL